jgi:hypothetical protein
MKWFLSILLAAVTSSFAFSQSTGNATQDLSTLHGRPEPPMLGVHWARGFDPLARANEVHAAGPRRSANMTYHGGKIMKTSNVQAIYWGTSWSGSNPKISGLASWYQGFGGSNYIKASTEYTGSNGQVGSTSSYLRSTVDNTAAANGSSTGAILSEVCKEITSGQLTLDSSGNGYYPVYVDRPRGNAGYCAYHSAGTCNGQLVQFAFFFNLDNDPGCDPQDTSGVHSQGLAALANVTGHELSEARTDPRAAGWYDASASGASCFPT